MADYYNILKKLREKKGLNTEEVELLGKEKDEFKGLENAFHSTKLYHYGSTLWVTEVLQKADAGFVELKFEDPEDTTGWFVSKKTIYKDYASYKTNYDPTDPDFQKIDIQIQSIKDTLNDISKNLKLVSYEDWKKIIIKTFPDQGNYDYNVNNVNWLLKSGASDTNPDGETLEQQKKNIVENAESKEPEELKQLYTDYIQNILSYTGPLPAGKTNEGKYTFTASKGTNTASGFDSEGVTEQYYEAVKADLVDGNGKQSDLVFYDVYYYSGGGSVASRIKDATQWGDSTEDAKEIQAQVAGNAPPPQDNEDEADYNIEEMYQYIDQCVLLSFISEISTEKTKAESDKKIAYPYNYTTIKILSNEPELTLNRMLIPRNIWKWFELNNTPYSTIGNFGVYRVGEAGTTDGVYRAINFQGYVEEGFSMNLNLKGTNPSTARADIKYDMSFKVKSLEMLNKNKRLFSLLERPGFVADSKGFNRWYKNQYHPSYYKKSVIYNIEVPGDGPNTFYGFDTTMIDHTIGLDESKSGLVDIKLDFMAYSESLMNLPYLDVLAGKKGLDARKNREALIEAAVQSDCDEDTLDQVREAVRISNAGQAKGAKQRIVQRIIELGLMSYVSVDYDEIKKAYNQKKRPKNSKRTRTVAKPKWLIWGQKPKTQQEAADETTKGTRRIHFFTLSDLIAVCSEMFFKTGHSSSMHDENKTNYDTDKFPGFEPQFLTFSFNYKNPTSGTIEKINCGDIPIAVSWFSKFMNDQYYSKDMDYVPIGAFLRDVVEKAFTQLVSEVCFSNEIDGKTHFRVSFFKGYKAGKNNDIYPVKNMLEQMRKKKIPLFSKAYGLNDKSVQASIPAPLFSYGKNLEDRLAGGDNLLPAPPELTPFSESDLVDYIVVHPFTQTYHSKNLKSEVSDYLEGTVGNQNANGSIPVIRTRWRPKADEQFQVYSNVKDMTFKKVEGKYLREQRMFYFNSDTFLAIGNVYDCDVTLNLVMPWFTPGMHVIIEPFTGDHQHWDNQDSIGTQIGMSGLYVIYNVTFKTAGTDYNGETILNCKWVNSAIDETGNLRIREFQKQKSIGSKTEPKICGQFRQLEDQLIASDGNIDISKTYPNIQKVITDIENKQAMGQAATLNSNQIPKGYNLYDANDWKGYENINDIYGQTIDELQIGESDDVLKFLRLNDATELEDKDGKIPAGEAKVYELSKPNGQEPKQFIIYKGQILQKP